MSETSIAKAGRAAIALAFPRIRLRRMQSGTIVIGKRAVHLGEKGWPDLIWFYPGPYAGFVEWKKHGEKPTADQLRVHGELRAMGFRVDVCESAQEAIECIRAALSRRAA